MSGGLDRRSFLKLAAIAASALAVPVGAQPVPLKPWKTQWSLGEIGGKTSLKQAKITPVICTYCSVGCSIDFYTIGDEVVWTTGSPDSAINFGTLCPKGKAAFEVVNNEARVLQPMIRTGPKPKPEEILNAKSWDELVELVKKYPPMWKPVSWDEAFRYIAEKTAQILNDWRQSTGAPKQKDGFYYLGNTAPIQLIGSSIMVNEGGYLTAKLAEFLGTTNIDSQYRKCHSSTVSGLALTYGWGAETASLEDVGDADVVLFFSSPAEAHPVSFKWFLKGKKERGTILITFDPRYSRTAAASDIWVPFRSGTDTAIFLYILHYAFFERSPPIDSLDTFNALKARWNITDADLDDFKELIKEYNADTVSRITGVPVDLLKTVAKTFVENSGVATNHKKHGIIQWAMGMTQHTNATINIIRAAAILQLLLGNVGYPGGGTHPFRGHSNVQGVTDMQGAGLGALPGYHAAPSAALVRVYQDWKLQGMPDAWNWAVPDWAVKTVGTTAPDKGKADLTKILTVFNFYGWRRFELLWGFFCGTVPEDDPQNGTIVCDFPMGAGASEITFPRKVLNKEIRAAFIFGENPAVTNPNAKVIWAALASLDLLVVSDIFETETAWFADVLLPAASFAETEGTRTNSNRVVQWTYAAVNPRGESRPDYWILTNLFRYLRKYGAVKLPSEVAGVKKERVLIKKGGKTYLLYERELRPDMSWDYSGGKGAATPVRNVEAEVNPRIINKEINFAVLIYHGMYDPIRDEYLSMKRSLKIRKPGEIDGTFATKFGFYKDWGWSWPANVRVMYSTTILVDTLGTTDKVYANGQTWEVTGETGEWIDEATGQYKPAFIPGHTFWLPRAFKRKLSGIADLYGGIDMMRFIRTNEIVPLGLFAVEEGGDVKLYSYSDFVAQTGMKYLYANDTLYWDQDTAIVPKATLKRVFFAGGVGWKDFKPTYDKMRETLKKYYQQTGNMRDAVNKTIQELGGWYKGYSFTWPIHTEPAESPDVEMALTYPTLAWLNPYNLQVLNESPDIVKDKPVGVALEPSMLKDLPGELVVITTNRLTEHWHSGSMTRRASMLAELDPEPFVYVPEKLAAKLGIKPGDLVEILTARGSVKMKAYVTKGEAYLTVNGKELPQINVIWAFSFLGYVTGPQGNFISPDVGDVITTIQETKAWIGKIRKAEVM